MKRNNLRWLWQPLYNIWKLWKEAVQSRKGRSKRAEWSQLFSRDYHLSSGLKSHGTRHIGVKSFIKSPQWHTYFFDFTRVIWNKVYRKMCWKYLVKLSSCIKIKIWNLDNQKDDGSIMYYSVSCQVLKGELLQHVLPSFMSYYIIYMYVQVNNYEIVINFFDISHNLTIVHKFTRIYPVCSTYELTKQCM